LNAGAPRHARLDRFVVGDPLRALAALSVLLFHVYAVPFSTHQGRVREDLGEPFSRLLESAYAGIYLFFVLSGYLIARPFLHAYLDGRPGPRLGGYLRNRVLRIVPAFWAVAALVLLVYGTDGTTAKFGGDASPADGVDVASIFLFAQNFTNDSGLVRGELVPAWSLHVELVFYALVPLAGLAIGRVTRPRLGPRGRLVVVLALTAMVLAVSLGLRSRLPASDLQGLRHFHTCVFAFMPGVLMAAIEPWVRRRITHGRRAAASGTVLTATGLGLLAVFVAIRPGGTGLEGLLLAVAMGALLGGLLVRQWSGRRPWRVLDNAPLQWLGTRSYSIYLLHLPVITWVYWPIQTTSRPEFLQLAVTSVALTALGAALLHRYVEQPALRLRARGGPQPEPLERRDRRLSPASA